MWYFPLWVLFLMAAQPAYAYLDPGTGSMVAQIAAAAVFGGLFFVKSVLKKTVLFIKSALVRKME